MSDGLDLGPSEKRFSISFLLLFLSYTQTYTHYTFTHMHTVAHFFPHTTRSLPFHHLAAQPVCFAGPQKELGVRRLYPQAFSHRGEEAVIGPDQLYIDYIKAHE